jgi:hypothetical protein
MNRLFYKYLDIKIAAVSIAATKRHTYIISFKTENRFFKKSINVENKNNINIKPIKPIKPKNNPSSPLDIVDSLL